MSTLVVNEFLLPDLGEGLTEAEIVCWLVAPGDTIAIDQPVVEVESAKSVVELPSPFGGVVGAVFGSPGQTVHAGQVLLTVSPAPLATDAAAPDSGHAAGATSGAVLVGYGTVERARSGRAVAAGRFGTGQRVTVPVSAPDPVPEPHDTVPQDTGPQDTVPQAGRRSPVVSPLVRRLARENGFDASQLTGSGRDSLVLRRDVEAHIAGLALASLDTSADGTAADGTAADGPAADGPARQAPAEPAPRPGRADTAGGRADIRIPITGLRKVVAQRLATSRREIPEATIWLDVDATELFVARDRLLAATGERFSVTALIARFVVAGLKKYPELNASVDTASQEILQHGSINLGLAAQTSRGLMVPVVHGAESMSTSQLRDAISGLVAQAGDGLFAPSALTGGTFTLNNFGALGVDGSAAIINHPEAAILGIGRMIERPWVVGHELAVRTVVELSMVFDHRVCDGGTAAGFLTYVARCIENPVSLLAEV
ncbi:2-oxo acid dehydrogenase subunit E2 [Cryobacterium frigoriphilum]|uniref:Dihydrolipoamide acetyltransferase component of pyruvate dehydrogenase complex n=1 Tax=Cryobacterium frigoriphilum TaxID=1259150 RepID=A0A4R8ZTC7_9MICO|nr:dihydrolipoamide acetyltransferase family protein [Cryobacterium frigoriphilum]TFD45129.1 2-oxo acid dehydrogenase subunit E2 [Cryobacterium frigoriphilum]